MKVRRSQRLAKMNPRRSPRLAQLRLAVTTEAEPTDTSDGPTTKRRKDDEVGRENEPDQKKRKTYETTDSTEQKKVKTAAESSDGDVVEVCISFDTTSSMYSCLDEVRRSVKDTIQRLLNDIPSIRIALVAHGDYGDEKTTYLIKSLDFTNDKRTLVDWVNNVERTNGFDGDECYELVLRDIQSLSWTNTASGCNNRSLVLIGDANPHPLNPKNRNPYQIDWREETQKLKDMDVRVYAVHALNSTYSRNFYQTLASMTDGTYLKLPHFDSIVDFLCGICYGQSDPAQVEAYEKELRNRKGGKELAPEVRELFDKLLGREAAAEAVAGGITPVARGRFKTLAVNRKRGVVVQIKKFVAENGLDFKTGRGFYQFTKPEVISMKKEIVLAHKKTGEMYTGESARKLLGITDVTSEMKMRIQPSKFKDFDIYVQSTSYNRNLVGGTKFMYEVKN